MYKRVSSLAINSEADLLYPLQESQVGKYEGHFLGFNTVIKMLQISMSSHSLSGKNSSSYDNCSLHGRVARASN